MNRSIIAASLTIWLGSSALATLPPIEQIAPENAVFVMSVSNARASFERIKSTPLYELWQNEQMQSLRKDAMEEFSMGVDELMMELGLDREHAVWPTGALGMAVYPVLDPEVGRMQPAYLAAADYEEEADKIWEVITAALERGEEDGQFEYELREILSRDVYLITLPAPDDEEMDEFGAMPFPMMPDVQAIAENFREIIVARDGSSILIASEIGSLTETLERIDNETLGVLTDRSDYTSLNGMIGRKDMHMMLLTRDIMPLISSMDSSGMFMMIGPMLQSVFGDIKGFATSIEIDAPDAMIIQRSAAYIPAGKIGLPALLDLTRPREDLPAFVGPDTISMTSLNVAFDRLPDVLAAIVQSNPMLQMQVGEQYPEIDAALRSLVATLGSRVYMTGSLRRPIDLDSMHNVVAIECKDTQAFENFLTTSGIGAGMEPRDFLGQRIFNMDNAGMMFGVGQQDLSMGLGGGHIILGPSRSVEQALRATSGQAGQPATLAEEPAYRRAIAALPDEPVTGWSYNSLADTIEAQAVASRLAMEQMLEEMRRDFPEIAAEMEAEMESDDDMFEEIDFDLIRQYLGPTVWTFRSTDQGFVGVSYVLEANQAANID